MLFILIEQLILAGCDNRMFNSVVNLGTLCVVEAVKSTYKVACDAADTLELALTVIFGTVAARTFVADNSGVAANGIAVYGVVDGAVTNAGLLHAANNLLECIQVLHGITVKLNVGDMTGIGKLMIRSFKLDLIIC